MWEDTEIRVLTSKYVTVKYRFVNDRTMLELSDEEKLHFSALLLFFTQQNECWLHEQYCAEGNRQETEEFLQEYLSGMLSLLQIKFVVGYSKT